MSGYGLIARADRGGLAAQTIEMGRHVPPAKVLLIDLGADGRGPTDPTRLDGIDAPVQRVPLPRPQQLPAWAVDWITDGVDVVYTAETPYSDVLPHRAAERGVRLVVHVNPELWNEAYRGATTEVVLPTGWEAERVAGSRVMPMPVDRDRIPWRTRHQARTFLFSLAPAMADRDGHVLVMQALRKVGYPIRLLIAGDHPGAGRSEQHGHVEVCWLGAREGYWSVYDQADVLVCPRRYGGLSLPTQEALAAGMPVIALARGAYEHHGGVLTVPATPGPEHRMKGGQFSVWDAQPRQVAHAIDTLASDPELVEELSHEADLQADSISWDSWFHEWEQLLS